MGPTFEQTDHYILRKLANEVLPWMIGGRRASKRWFVRLAAVHAYGGEAATALTGLGVGTPLVAAAQGDLPNGQSAIEVLRQALPGFWLWVGLAALVAWAIVRIVVTKEDALRRSLFAKDCARTMRSLRTQLWVALGDAAPMPRILEIQEATMQQVGDAQAKDVWPYEGAPPYEAIELELRELVDDIREKFMSNWAPPPPQGV